MPTRRDLLAAGAVLAAAGFAHDRAQAVTPADPVDVLLGKIRERLDVAPLVARSKWNGKGSIEDLDREAALLARVTGDAPGFGIDPAKAARFMRAQIEASKVVQAGLFARWAREGQGLFADAPDLRAAVRPVLDRLTPELSTALRPVLAVPGPDPSARIAAHTLHDDPLFGAALAVAVAPLLEWARAG